MLNILIGKIKPYVYVIKFLAAVGLGVFVGYPLAAIKLSGKYEKIITENNKGFQEQLAKHKEIENTLLNNANEWKKQLDDAQSRAISTAKVKEEKTADLEIVTKVIQSKPKTIIKEVIKNECKATDIIVNTDGFDSLLSCFTDKDPRQCANNH